MGPLQGCSVGSPLPGRAEIIAVRYHFHTEISRERELTFVTGAAAVYGEQHTMHHRWAVSRGEEKHEGKLSFPRYFSMKMISDSNDFCTTGERRPPATSLQRMSVLSSISME